MSQFSDDDVDDQLEIKKASPAPKHQSVTQGSVYLITSDGRTLDLPIASPSPCDPLNWSSTRKWSALAAMALFNIVASATVQVTSLMLVELGQEYPEKDILPFRVDMLSSVPTLVTIIGALLWIPLSYAIGRRPVFVLCSVLLTLSIIAAAFSTDFYTHLAARCAQGIMGAFSYSVTFIMLIDITYVHQRPNYIAAFFCFCTGMANVIIAFTPYLISATGTWRSLYQMLAMLSGLNSIMVLVMVPETYFKRPPVSFDGLVLSQSQEGRVTLYPTWQAVPGADQRSGKEWMQVLEHQEKKTTCPVFGNWILVNRTWADGPAAIGRFWRQLPLSLFNPLVIWVLTQSALVIGGMVVTCATYASILEAPPYNFTPHQVGLSKFSTAIGVFLAYPVCGTLTIHICRALTRRNRGVREPEHYLPSFIISVMTASVSLALYGLAEERQWASTWILFFVGLNYFSANALLVSNALWVTEAFPRWAAPGLVVVIGGGFALSFGVSSAIGPWIQGQGLARAYWELSATTVAVGLVGIPVTIWGKRVREYIYGRWDTND